MKSGLKKNDEARMTNDERSPKSELRSDVITIVRHLIIRHSFELHHSDFVIYFT
jgi:hypothetical protein